MTAKKRQQGGIMEGFLQSLGDALERFLQIVAAVSPGGGVEAFMTSASPAIYVLGWIVLLVGLVVGLKFNRRIRPVHSTSRVDTGLGLLIGAILGGLTGLLWASYNPIKIVPPYIHLRLFSFLTALVGIVVGRGTGFVTGYVATQVWALLAGAFVAPHQLLFDGIFVGLTGWIPAVIVRGDKTFAEMFREVQNNKRLWFLKAAIAGGISGLFMSFFVASSLELTTPLTFWVSFWAIGVISDTPPLLLTGPLTYGVMKAVRRASSWMPQF